MNDLERHVLELIGEDPDSPDVFIDDSTGMSQIRDSLNDAIEEISMVTGCYRDRYYLPLRANQYFYRMYWTGRQVAILTDVWLVGQERRLEQTDLIRLNNHNPRWMRVSRTPWSYFPIGMYHLGIYPAPSSDDDILDITAVVVPKRYSEDTDRIKLRDDFKWAAVHFAVSEYWASRGDAKTARYHHGEYLVKLGLQDIYPAAQEHIYQYKTEKEPWPVETP